MTRPIVAERPAAIRRHDELEAMLEKRRDDLLREVQSRVRDARADGALEHGVVDEGEQTERDAQRELGFALMQMATETLEKIEAALRRLDEGSYGDCVECLEPISQARLRALPFAIRCTRCEGAREIADRQQRSISSDGSSRPFSPAGLNHADRSF